MSLSSVELAIIGTLGGAIVGGVFTVIIAVINKRSEERKHYRELIVNASIENWKHLSEISKAKYIQPMSDFIFHMVKVCDLALDKKTNINNIQQKLDEIYEINNIVRAQSIKSREEKLI